MTASVLTLERTENAPATSERPGADTGGLAPMFDGPYCACGCRERAKKGNRFIKGHNKGRLNSARRAANVAAHRQKWFDAGVPYGTCLCGCGEDTVVSTGTDAGHGWFENEPREFVQEHDKVLSACLYEVDEETGCWMWKRGINPGGYAQYKGGLGHRWFWQEKNGPVSEGLDLHHVCERRACVNPDHLEPVTRRKHLAFHRPLGGQIEFWCS